MKMFDKIDHEICSSLIYVVNTAGS